ncbi:hypothetical protein QBC35DRAFT_118170 [Podospora australis]|uniref:Uncharacterized protein n=1 Tax=Podospora australis TaxID=1536484 RepID=A0AAN7AKF9_9PEZI|nr:hypothetical protein QBC35DRAFT_118170 [Podospora australis]
MESNCVGGQSGGGLPVMPPMSPPPSLSRASIPGLIIHTPPPPGCRPNADSLSAFVSLPMIEDLLCVNQRTYHPRVFHTVQKFTPGPVTRRARGNTTGLDQTSVRVLKTDMTALHYRKAASQPASLVNQRIPVVWALDKARAFHSTHHNAVLLGPSRSRQDRCQEGTTDQILYSWAPANPPPQIPGILAIPALFTQQHQQQQYMHTVSYLDDRPGGGPRPRPKTPCRGGLVLITIDWS